MMHAFINLVVVDLALQHQRHYVCVRLLVTLAQQEAAVHGEPQENGLRPLQYS